MQTTNSFDTLNALRMLRYFAVDHDSIASYGALDTRDDRAILAAAKMLAFCQADLETIRASFRAWIMDSTSPEAEVWQAAWDAAEIAWYGPDPRPRSGGVSLYWNEAE
jgi:hypothetical protein